MSKYFRDWGSNNCPYILVGTEGFTWDHAAIEESNMTLNEYAAIYGQLEMTQEFENRPIFLAIQEVRPYRHTCFDF